MAVVKKSYDFRKYNDLTAFFYHYKGKLTRAVGELKAGKTETYEFMRAKVKVYMQASGPKGHLEVEIDAKEGKAEDIFNKLEHGLL